MWRITWRDLLYRRRRFLIAAAGTAIVLSVALMMAGVVVAVRSQNERAVTRFHADGWWVPVGAGGPFTAGPVVPESAVAQLERVPGIVRAEPVVLLRTTLSNGAGTRASVTDVNLVGIRPTGLGRPTVGRGRWLRRPGETVLDDTLGHHVGDVVYTGGKRLTVVGLAHEVSYLFAVPTMFLGLRDAQDVGAGGQRSSSAVVTQGSPRAPGPPGLVDRQDPAVLRDLNRVIGKGLSAVQTVEVIMLVAAAAIVALIVYLSAIERMRDVAVLKVSGASNGFVAAGLVVQGVTVTVPAAIVALGLARLLEPVFPLELALTSGVQLQTFALAVGVGLLSSLVGVRRLLTVDPSEAFG